MSSSTLLHSHDSYSKIYWRGKEPRRLQTLFGYEILTQNTKRK